VSTERREHSLLHCMEALADLGPEEEEERSGWTVLRKILRLWT